MKYLNITLRILLILLLISPILGVLGVFPAPTADLYNTPEAFAFISTLFVGAYIPILIALVFAAAIVLTIMNRMAAVALLILPITVNIVAFHLILDGGLFTAGAIMANVLALINIYFLWQNCSRYKALFAKNA